MLKKLFLISIALIAFAGNSVLCRYALKDDVIDASSFTAIRLISGAVFLIGLVAFKNKLNINWKGGSWLSAFWLFLYAAAFSFAYISLKTGIGALILFGAVQITMVLMNLIKGQRLLWLEWFGLVLAFSGLAYLLIPSSTSPSLVGSLLMAVSGVAWGFYTLAGRGSLNPLVDTANNFLKSIPFVLICVLVFVAFYDLNITGNGIVLAVVSGAITSGLGYAIWYLVLDTISVTQAAVIQLTVPIIAAFGGVVFASEAISMELVVSSMLVLGGVLLVTAGKKISLSGNK
jgi:drug/metabolite transporter (DMT)-like permease